MHASGTNTHPPEIGRHHSRDVTLVAHTTGARVVVHAVQVVTYEAEPVGVSGVVIIIFMVAATAHALLLLLRPRQMVGAVGVWALQRRRAHVLERRRAGEAQSLANT